jgi:hypothetical protein
MQNFTRLFGMVMICTALMTVQFTVQCVAQDDKLKDFSFEDVPTEESKPPYFAAAGGFVVSALFQDYTQLNNFMQAYVGSSVSSPLLMTGGQAFVAIGIIPNVRVGFTSLFGSSAREQTSGTPAKRAEYSVTMNGINIDYAFTPLKGLAIVPGVLAGWGNVALEASQSGNTQSYTQRFPPPASQTNYLSRISAAHIFVQPNLNIEYAFALVSMIRVNAGYSLSFMQQWRADNIVPLGDVPSSFNASGLTVQVGLFFGLFNN